MRLVQLRGHECCRNASGLLHGPPARRRGRHCFGSDGPTEPARNMGLKAIVLFAAYVTMPKYTDPALRQDRWASYIGNPKDAGSCKRPPTQGGTIPRRAQAPPHAALTHRAEPPFSGCSSSILRPRRAIPWPRIERNARSRPYLSHSPSKEVFITAIGFVLSCCSSVLSPYRERGGRLI